jgi:hypothetical protein
MPTNNSGGSWLKRSCNIPDVTLSTQPLQIVATQAREDARWFACDDNGGRVMKGVIDVIVRPDFYMWA